jgi:uncharacterized protein
MTIHTYRYLLRAGEHPFSTSQMAAIGRLTLELYLPLNDSLKGKRGILKPLIARLRRDYNISVCEADAQDVLTRASLEVVCVSQSSALAHRQLQNVAQRVEEWRLDAQLIDYYIEMVA